MVGMMGYYVAAGCDLISTTAHISQTNATLSYNASKVWFIDINNT